MCECVSVQEKKRGKTYSNKCDDDDWDSWLLHVFVLVRAWVVYDGPRDTEIERRMYARVPVVEQAAITALELMHSLARWVRAYGL